MRGVFCPAPEFGENDFLSLHGQDLCPKNWATPEAKVCSHSLYCSFPSCVVVHSISCWCGVYPLHSLRGGVESPSHVDLSLRSICEKETGVQGSPIAFSPAVPQTLPLPLETPLPRRLIPTLSLFLRKASPLISVQRHLYSSTTFVCAFRCAKVFLRRTDVVGEMASKWVWTSPASNCETILLYSFVLVVHPLLVVCIQVQTCSPTLPVLSRIVPLASGNPKSWKAKSVELRKCLTRAFRSSAPEKILGEIYLEDGVAPVLQQTFQCWKSLLQIFHLHLCDMDLRNKIVEKRYFWEQGLQLFFCFAVCFGFDSRYSVNDSTARSICWNGVQQLGVFVGASKCFSHKVGNA